MHLVTQATGSSIRSTREGLKPMGVWVNGDRTDDAYRAAKWRRSAITARSSRIWGWRCRRRSPSPQVLALRGGTGAGTFDFYAGCVYNRGRTEEELRKLMGRTSKSLEKLLQDDPRA